MKASTRWILQCVLVCATSSIWAQKKVPYKFNHQSDSSIESLQVLTEVSESASTFLRLYFEGTQLGSESYLILEAADGAKQQLRNEDLENWSFNSAYFNGNNVRVSLFSAKGELNRVSINAIKITDPGTEVVKRPRNAGKQLSASAPRQGNTAIDYDALPYAAAVGRFTDGNDSYGTGWIAPNGAIVTDADNVQNVINGNKDIIEFNVPPSDEYGIVNHPGPEDQYPLRYRNETMALFGFDFKRKHNFNLANEEVNSWTTSWGILEALPNSTGLRPGERQQQYFRIAPNLGSFTLESQEVMVDILHYGETESDLLDDGSHYRTLKRHTTQLLPQNEYITRTDFDIEGYMVYNLNGGNITFTDCDRGAPITYSGYNIAMGLHNDFYNYAPAVGVGFKNDGLLTGLNDYFSSAMVYVDQQSLWDEPTGAIDKPSLDVRDGIERAEIGGIVNIVKGNYSEPMYITKAVTLKAPVGLVVLGEGGAMNARKGTLPRDTFMPAGHYLANTTDESSGSGFTSFPNPFSGSTALQYELPQSTAVRINVYDKWGNKVRSLVQETAASGTHSVVWEGNDQSGKQAAPGLYVIRLDTPEKSTAIRVIKNQ